MTQPRTEEDLRFLTMGWERAVLGTGLAEPETMEYATDLMPSDFSGSHSEIWAEMLVLHRRGALELRALVEALRERNRLDSIGAFDVETSGEGYIAELYSARGDAMQEYADRVLGASIKRQLLQAGALISADALDVRVHAEEALDAAERRLLTLRRNRIANLGLSMFDLFSIFSGRIAGMRDGTIEPAWVPKLEPLKETIQYAEKDDFIICASRPGQGKSSLMRFEFIHAAMNGMPCTIFNLENGEIEYARYMIALTTGIDSLRLRDPRQLTEPELETVRNAVERLQNIPLTIVTLGAPPAVEIERISRQHIQRHGTRLIGVDYLQLVKNGIPNKVQDVSETSGILRAIALNYGVPVWANSQMSREVIHRGGEPELSDLRESGSIEQDGTIIIFPWPVWDVPTEAQLRTFEQNIDPATGNLYPGPKAVPNKIFVKKHRNGSTGVTRNFLWIKSTNNYVPFARQPEIWA